MSCDSCIESPSRSTEAAHRPLVEVVVGLPGDRHPRELGEAAILLAGGIFIAIEEIGRLISAGARLEARWCIFAVIAVSHLSELRAVQLLDGRGKSAGSAAAKNDMRNGRGPSLPSRRRGATVLVLTCAASAGAHAGLVPAHLNGEARLGAAFLVAVVLLIAAAIAVAAHPGDQRITGAAGLLLAGLMLAYLATRTTGIPVIDPEPEALDAVGIATNVAETLGVLAALCLIQPAGRHTRPADLQEVSQ